jgi:hypothetical protein
MPDDLHDGDILMSLAPLLVIAAMVAVVPNPIVPHMMVPKTGQESAPHGTPAKPGSFTVKSAGGTTIAGVSIKGGTHGNPATMVITLQPAKPGGPAPTAVSAAAQVVMECVPGASTFFKFGPFVNGRATKVVSYIQYQEIGTGFGFLVTNNGVSGCTKLPSTMMAQGPSAQSMHTAPGSYGSNCPSAHMQGKILVASCLGGNVPGGDGTIQSQINPASCHGRDIVEKNGKLACGAPGSHPPG